MRPGARIKAASDILEDILVRHRTCAQALADWGKANRYAGSGDRGAIGNLVYDALRRKQSLAARMGSDKPRALALAAAPQAFGLTVEELIAAADGSTHALEPVSKAERAALTEGLPHATAAHIAGDIPDWLMPSFTRVFGDNARAEGEALAARAPIDIRVNTLKTDRDTLLAALGQHKPEATRFAETGIRLAARLGAARQPNIEAENAHGKGWFEVQDEGSQIAAHLVGAKPGHAVLDLCAGAGGKTLALAALMQGKGQIHAYDDDKFRLRPLFERLARSGASNVEVMDAGDVPALKALGARFDRVLADAPCTGTGTWRRRPDAKWRLKANSLKTRQDEQRAVLDLAHGFVKPGGRLIYVTCSLLAEENSDQIDAFLGAHPDFALVPWRDAWRDAIDTAAPLSADRSDRGLLLSPAQHGTDGFFVAVLTRAA
jgi:16S rRNA (cytosine967-C5)-methyltransferase